MATGTGVDRSRTRVEPASPLGSRPLSALPEDLLDLLAGCPGWTVPRDSFFQNNFFLLPTLVDTVRNCLLAARTKHLLDIYCGVGFFSVELADAVQSFIGVELDQMAISAARKNAASRARTNGEFIAGLAEELLPSLLQRLPADSTSVLLDPPRKGCRPEMLEALRASPPAQVIYVSCHPATMARDLNVLCSGGVFNLARVTPLDMFPQTQHVESVADIRRNVQAPIS